MDGWIQIHGWLASRPARFFKKKGRAGSIQPARGPAQCQLRMLLKGGFARGGIGLDNVEIPSIIYLLPGT